MADLESSLTAIDWLSRLSVGVGNLTSDKGNGPGQDAGSDRDMDSDGEDYNGSGRDSKPAYSYAHLITFAINSSPEKRMTLSEIYQWICDKYPYYRIAGNGWKVSGMYTTLVFDRNVQESLNISLKEHASLHKTLQSIPQYAEPFSSNVLLKHKSSFCCKHSRNFSMNR